MARIEEATQPSTPRILPVGGGALVVEFGTTVDPAVNARVLALDAALAAAAPPGVVETVPTFRSLMVHYDPGVTGAATLGETIAGLLDHAGEAPAAERTWRIPVCYQGDDLAPDLAEVAARTGLAPEDVIAIHTGGRYRVYMLGFLPGFPYMGDLDRRLVLPRRADPRVRVPAGAVAIATTLTAVYPVESPGGWHLIGASPARLFDPARDPPVPLAPGDAVVFEPVPRERFAALKARAAAGEPVIAEAP